MQCLMTPEMPSLPKIYDTVSYACPNGVKDYVSAELLHYRDVLMMVASVPTMCCK